MRCLRFWGDFGQPVSWSSGLCSFVAGWIWLEVESHPATSPPRRALLTIRHHSRQVFQLLGQTHLTPGENYSCVVPYSICWLSILTLCPPPGSGWLFVPRTHGFPIAAPGRPFGVSQHSAYIHLLLIERAWVAGEETYLLIINFKMKLVLKFF